jgi:hypothetical protein
MPLRNFRERLSKLLDQTRDSAQQNIPAEQVRNQLPSRTLPPATGTSKGGVTLSDSTPASVGTAAPGTAADVSRHDHVHAHGNQAGGSLHPAATTSVAGFLSAADKTLLDALPIPQYLTLALTGTLTNERRVVAGTGITLTDGGAGGDLTIAASAAGTVTSVALTAPAEISVAGSPITGAGTLALTWANATANRVFAGPTSGSPATPAFRALDPLDIPNLAASKIASGQLALARGGTNADLSATGGANQFLKQSSAGAAITVGALVAGDIPDLSATYQPLDADLTAIAALSSTGLAARTAANTWAQRTLTGTASRIAITNGNGVSGNPTVDIDAAYVGQASLTTLGTIGTGVWQGTKVGLAYGGTNADLSATGGANQIVRQNSAGGALTVSALAAADIPNLDSAKITSGEIPRSPLTTRGDLLTRDATTHARLAIGAAGKYVRSDGTDPSWQAIPYTDLTYSGLTNGQVWRATGSGTADFGRIDFSLSVAFTGQLLTIYGGTGIASYTTGDLIYASGSTALSKLADVATGNALISGGVTTAPSWGKIALTTHVSGVLPAANGGTGVAALPSFFVHKNGSDQTGIVTATYTLVTWSTEVFDSHADFASNRFTPTIAGTYLINVTIYWSSQADQAYMLPIIYKNGVLYAQTPSRASGTGDQGSSCVAVVQMNGSTDYLEAYAYQGSGSNKNISGVPSATYFTGAWIGP